MTTRTRQRISVSLTAIAVVLWTHSILHATLEIGHFGLIHGLPVTFFVAFAFLTVASALLWVSPERHGKLLFLQLALLISGLWLVPAITGGSPPFTDHAYRNLGMIEYVVRNGHFDGVVIWYQSWPGAFILSAAAAEISSINFEPALPLFPYLMQLLYLLPLYVFLHNTLGQPRGNYIWAGAWLFSLGNWIGQNYFGPSGVALFLLLTLLALVTSTSMWQRNSRSLILLCLALLVFAALAMTHLLTSLAALCILGALCLVKRSKYLAMGVALCLVMVVCWDLIGAHGYIVNRFLPGPAGETAPSAVLSIDPGAVGEREVTGHFIGSESHVAVALTRVPFSAIFALIGVAGAFLTLVVRRRFSTGIPVLAIALAPMVLLAIGAYYGQEILHRLYLFALAPMAYFGAELLAVNKRWLTAAISLLLIAGLPLHVIAHYGNEAMDYVSPAQIAGLHSFHDHTSEGYLTRAGYLREMENAERYYRIPIDMLCLADGGVAVQGTFDPALPHYVRITRQDREFYRFYRGTPEDYDDVEHRLAYSANYNLVYDDVDLRLYAAERIEAVQECEQSDQAR